MTDPAAIRWESLGTIVAALGLAVWALRETDPTKPRSRAEGPLIARFRVRASGKPARTFDLESGSILGRGGNCAAVVDDPTVSKSHARVGFDGRAWIEDLDSTNGTFVNGRRVAGSTWLRRGDRIGLGAAKIVFLGLIPRNSNGPKG
jgi:FHA domain-containing protein